MSITDTRTDSNTAALSRAGVSIWLDDLSRERIVTKNLQQLIEEKEDRKSTRLNSSHSGESRMPSSA